MIRIDCQKSVASCVLLAVIAGSVLTGCGTGTYEEKFSKTLEEMRAPPKPPAPTANEAAANQPAAAPAPAAAPKQPVEGEAPAAAAPVQPAPPRQPPVGAPGQPGAP